MGSRTKRKPPRYYRERCQRVEIGLEPCPRSTNYVVDWCAYCFSVYRRTRFPAYWLPDMTNPDNESRCP